MKTVAPHTCKERQGIPELTNNDSAKNSNLRVRKDGSLSREKHRGLVIRNMPSGTVA